MTVGPIRFLREVEAQHAPGFLRLWAGALTVACLALNGLACLIGGLFA